MRNYLPLLEIVGNLLCKQAEVKLPSPRAYTPQYNTNTLFEIYLCEQVNRCIKFVFEASNTRQYIDN